MTRIAIELKSSYRKIDGYVIFKNEFWRRFFSACLPTKLRVKEEGMRKFDDKIQNMKSAFKIARLYLFIVLEPTHAASLKTISSISFKFNLLDGNKALKMVKKL